jgi:hypothetical protein
MNLQGFTFQNNKTETVCGLETNSFSKQPWGLYRLFVLKLLLVPSGKLVTSTTICGVYVPASVSCVCVLLCPFCLNLFAARFSVSLMVVFFFCRSGGNWSTTYAPSPFYMTSKMRSLYLEGYEYSIFDLTRPDRVQIQVGLLLQKKQQLLFR